MLTLGGTCCVSCRQGRPNRGCSVLACSGSIWATSGPGAVGSTERVHLPGLSPLCPLLCGRLRPASDGRRAVRPTGRPGSHAGSVSVEVAASPACPGVPGIHPGLAQAGTRAHGLSPMVPGSHRVRPHASFPTRVFPVCPAQSGRVPSRAGRRFLGCLQEGSCFLRGGHLLFSPWHPEAEAKGCATRVIVRFPPGGRTAGSEARRLQFWGTVVRDNPPSPFCLSLTPEGPLASGQCFALHRTHPGRPPSPRGVSGLPSQTWPSVPM